MLLFLLIAIAISAGAMIGTQPSVNAALAKQLSSPFAAALVSLGVSVLILIPFVLLTVGKINLSNAAMAPWWVWIGGMAGAAFVISGLTVAPILGAAMFSCAVIGGQLIAAAVIDQHGLFGTPERPLTLWRLAGLLLTGAGVLVFRFAK